MVLGATAYGLWGLFPLYWTLLSAAGALETLAHRMIWSLVAVGIVLAVDAADPVVRRACCATGDSCGCWRARPC